MSISYTDNTGFVYFDNYFNCNMCEMRIDRLRILWYNNIAIMAIFS